ncbi:MAG: Asp-tRNA(Asn)/Glu-tRNA(Gln) amidotransferase subunit GatC [bacterium]|nr:Asp-tRNA(Asn)/Glu-tRNA(Gln) amidotransferase subunit GatC [bacterium]
MTDKVDVRALAQLARLEVSDEELAKLEREIPDILKFVETIQAVSAQGYDEPKKVSGKSKALSPQLMNVMREDENPHEGGAYTDALMKAAPARVGNRIAVKQVIKRGTSH